MRNNDRTDRGETAALHEAGDFRQCLELAERNGDRDSIIRYALLLASQSIKEKSPIDALKILNKYNSVFMFPEAKKAVLRIAGDIYSFEPIEPDLTSWKLLRDCLLQIVSTSANDAEQDVFEKFLLISHFHTLKCILEKCSDHANAFDLSSKLTIALLRYTDIIRVDKAFFEAGKVAKESGKLEMAFVFWNHFLDLVDAIEEGEYNVDHSDFVGTDIPFEVPLPSAPFCAENAPKTVEDAKNWILQVSMDSSVMQELPKDPFRDGEVYEASLINADSSLSLPCLVTGYPVIRHKMLEFKPGKYAANKDDWNKLLMLTKVRQHICIIGFPLQASFNNSKNTFFR